LKSPHQRRVEEFMVLAGQEVPEKPCIPSEEVRRLRAKLILEEALETIAELGFEVCFTTLMDNDIYWMNECDVFFTPSQVIPNISLSGIADGCCDISVVTVGTMIACGVDMEPILELVDDNNLAKFGPGGHRREDGKWVKPPDHQPPDIISALKIQGWNE
jgi:predicted HAD superfamily Cof-like phosphohydrolase